MGIELPLQSFPVTSGDYLQPEFTVTDRDDNTVDLTGGSGRFAMARRPGETLVIDSDAGTATLTVTDAANGLVKVEITDENTDSLAGSYYWALKWTDGNGREALSAHGYMTMESNLI